MLCPLVLWRAHLSMPLALCGGPSILAQVGPTLSAQGSGSPILQNQAHGILLTSQSSLGLFFPFLEKNKQQKNIFTSQYLQQPFSFFCLQKSRSPTAFLHFIQPLFPSVLMAVFVLKWLIGSMHHMPKSLKEQFVQSHSWHSLQNTAFSSLKYGQADNFTNKPFLIFCFFLLNESFLKLSLSSCILLQAARRNQASPNFARNFLS